jgi:hypothetical protein
MQSAVRQPASDSRSNWGSIGPAKKCMQANCRVSRRAVKYELYIVKAESRANVALIKVETMVFVRRAICF